MDMTAAFREVGTYRGAAAMCGCDPKTIKRALARLSAGDAPAERKEPERNYDVVRDVVAARVRKTAGKIWSAPTPGSPRRFCDPACRQAAYRRRRAGVAETTPRQPTGGRNRHLTTDNKEGPPPPTTHN